METKVYSGTGTKAFFLTGQETRYIEFTGRHIMMSGGIHVVFDSAASA